MNQIIKLWERLLNFLEKLINSLLLLSYIILKHANLFEITYLNEFYNEKTNLLFSL